MTNCTEAQSKLNERLDGQLDESQQRAFDVHVEGCASCCELWRAHVAAWELLKQQRSIEPSFGFAERTLRRLEQSVPAARPWFWLPAFRWAFVSLALVALGLGAWIGRQRMLDAKAAETYAQVQRADYLEDYDVIAWLDQYNGESNL